MIKNYDDIITTARRIKRALEDLEYKASDFEDAIRERDDLNDGEIISLINDLEDDLYKAKNKARRIIIKTESKYNE